MVRQRSHGRCGACLRAGPLTTFWPAPCMDQAP
ncbi:hypothetical protein CBM2605_B170042 [Cupriavidus neocaledonicus]|uniref:Uncharacterized protein n=1 Tax=Cupriavidus neocaledonicus TaxID=1040979 RepID=A0ABY1V9P5_9BURK|nr:hypothetical protein CBM2605_B170042 [Cupriavidus neocaledonicus]